MLRVEELGFRDWGFRDYRVYSYMGEDLLYSGRI